MAESNQSTIEDRNKKQLQYILPIFRLGFRPFFLMGALFGFLAIGVWGLSFSAWFEFSPYGGAYFWHSHEMLFGYTVAIIIGFLLTAVQNWTGVQTVKGKALAALVSVWLLGRILFAFPLLPTVYIIIVDVLFLPLAACFFAIPIIKVKLWRNLFFVPILLVMACLNLLMHLSLHGSVQTSFLVFSHVMVMMIALVMCIMGGRVIPMFTANGTQTEKVLPVPLLENLSIALVIASVIVVSDLITLSTLFQAVIFISAGVVNFVRAVRWRIWVTIKTPLVWSLHVSYWMMCLGLVLLALNQLNYLPVGLSAYHAITIGGIGLMTLSMISRVSLGHTGRKIVVGWQMNLAFIFMFIAFVCRVLVPVFWQDYNTILLLASLFWLLAFGIFLVKFFPVLTRARIDGKQG
ncbi:MAG: NnrS family protein [Gammaproteobacteria bacterium]|nr:NnrS family protein [Gammaproteobacteria bacterium]